MAIRPRSAIRWVGAGMLHYSGLSSRWQRSLGRGNRVCVLGLHRVLAEADRTNSQSSIILRESTFARMLEFIGERYRVISLDEFLAAGTARLNENKPPCLLTFDDGWQDNFTRAYPVLRERGFPAIIFLATGFIGTRYTFWVERLKRVWNDAGREWFRSCESRLPGNGNPSREADSFDAAVERLKHMPADQRQGLLDAVLPAGEIDAQEAGGDSMFTWEQAAEMKPHGIEFGAHTVTHPLLTYEPEALVRRELSLGKQMIEEKLGVKVRAFAYPNGDWNARVSRLVAEAGYDCAFTVQRGWCGQGNDPFSLPRILLHEGMMTSPKGRFSAALLNLSLTGWR